MDPILSKPHGNLWLRSCIPVASILGADLGADWWEAVLSGFNGTHAVPSSFPGPATNIIRSLFELFSPTESRSESWYWIGDDSDMSRADFCGEAEQDWLAAEREEQQTSCRRASVQAVEVPASN